MKLSRILLTSAFALSTLFMSAQTKTQEVTEEVFNPHWYLQAQIGVQETLGETSFGKLISPNGQLALGYQFNPYIGTRLVLNAWQSKGAFEFKGNRNVWKYNYVAPTLNVTADLTNILGGYKPNRVVSVGIFAGIGANIGFSNDEALEVKNMLASNGIDALGLYWDGTKARFLGQMGANVDFKVSKRVSLGIELQANVLPDSYNSKEAKNADWYFNALAGVKIALGKTTKKVTKTVEIPVIYETKTVHDTVIVERVVEKTVEVAPEPKKEPLRRDIFFTIAKTQISKAEMAKVEEVANYLKANPDAKVVITGYADKGTGSVAINMRLSKQRAQKVADVLTSKYGIASSHITVKSMDESFEQPYNDPVQNRVAICIAE